MITSEPFDRIRIATGIPPHVEEWLHNIGIDAKGSLGSFSTNSINAPDLCTINTRHRSNKALVLLRNEIPSRFLPPSSNISLKHDCIASATNSFSIPHEKCGGITENPRSWEAIQPTIYRDIDCPALQTPSKLQTSSKSSNTRDI